MSISAPSRKRQRRKQRRKVVGLTRLAVSFATGLRLKRAAGVIDSPELLDASRRAAELLRLAKPPEVRVSASVHCPVVWCWGRRPVLILPAGTAKIGKQEYQVQLNSSPEAVQALNDLPIKTVNGVTIYIKDVAHVRDGFQVQTNVVHANGKPGVKPAVLLPGDVVVATANSILETKKSVQDLSDKLGWRQGMLVFHHTTLADAAAEFNRYNREKIVIGDTAIARLTINGTFPSRNVGDFTHLTQEVFGLHVEKQGDIAVLSR